MIALIVTLLAICLLLYGLYRPQHMILAYIVSLGWIPWSVGRDILGPMDLDDLLLLGAGVVALLGSGGRSAAGPNPLQPFLVLYWVGTLIGNAVGVVMAPGHVEFILRQMFKDFGTLAFFLLLPLYFRDKREMHALGYALLAGGIGIVATVTLQYFFPESALAQSWQTKTVLGDIERSRIAGVANETYNAGAVLIGLASLLISFLLFRNLFLKLIAAPGLAAVAWAVAAGQSRATYLGVGIVVLGSSIGAAMITRARRGLLGAITIIALTVVLGLSTAFTQRLLYRVEGASFEQSRMIVIRRYFAELSEFALTGCGFFYQTITTRATAHNAYLEALFDGGLISFFAFCGLWYPVLTSLKYIRRWQGMDLATFSFGYAAFWASIAFLITSFFLGFVFDNYYRVVFLLWLSFATSPYWRSKPDEGVALRYGRGRGAI